jgi:hydroxymethylpyrimidine pyrophosphatase-like HAD family hydrolase
MPIRLICSDIDGTLLQYGRKALERSVHRTTRKMVALSVPGACFKGSVL